MPPTLRLTILRRLSFLSETTLTALRAASILGSSFTFTELSVTMAQPALDLAWILAEGITAQVLEDDGARLRFRHDLIREALYEDLPLSVRRGLHREAGRRLAESGAPVLQVAEQLARGAKESPCDSTRLAPRARGQVSPAAAATEAGQQAIAGCHYPHIVDRCMLPGVGVNPAVGSRRSQPADPVDQAAGVQTLLAMAVPVLAAADLAGPLPAHRADPAGALPLYQAAVASTGWDPAAGSRVTRCRDAGRGPEPESARSRSAKHARRARHAGPPGHAATAG